MRHRKDGFKLGRLTQHRWAMFRNLLVALFRHERITTTEANPNVGRFTTSGIRKSSDSMAQVTSAAKV